MKTYITKQIKLIDKWAEYPERDPILFDDCGQIIREAARRASRAGFFDVYKRHHKVTHCTPEEARAILESILSTTEPEPEFLTPPQAAKLLGVNPDKVRGWIRTGRLPAVKSGRAYKIKRTDLDALRETAQPKTYQPRDTEETYF